MCGATLLVSILPGLVEITISVLLKNVNIIGNEN